MSNLAGKAALEEVTEDDIRDLIIKTEKEGKGLSTDSYKNGQNILMHPKERRQI